VNVKFSQHDALLVVDLQYDFLPEGALHVPQGNVVIPIINTLIAEASKGQAMVIASRDWHPADHISFHEQGGPWPPHCIQNTHGAEFHKNVQFPQNTIIVSKAFKADHEAYSAFAGETTDGQPLANVLKKQHVNRLIICGLALDYCVKATSFDAVKEGFEAVVIEDATRAINEEDGQEAIRLLKSFGVVFTDSSHIG
jgi:nicotinamidase/pyrazinamidase